MNTEKRYLFLGVGGMGMAPLAGWMSGAGYSVCGYDDNMQEPSRRFLEKSGVALPEFILEAHLGQYDVVVHSSALGEKHPLLMAARSHGLEVLRRGELLARVAEGRRLLAVAGSHGKTTTCGLAAYALSSMGLNVDYILGGFFSSEELPACQYAGSEWLVAEVDESDGTIDQFNPEVTLLLNADWDHADRYKDERQILETFRGLLERTKSQVLLPAGCPVLDEISKGLSIRVNRFAADGKGDYESQNRSAALALVEALPGGGAAGSSAFNGFPGMARRLSLLHDSDSLRIYEDYAHHPTEIDSLLARLRGMEEGRRLVVVFQPHRYSRTRQFKHGLAESLGAADACFLLPVYGAYEAGQDGGGLDTLLGAFGSGAPEVLPMNLEGAERLGKAVSGGHCSLVFVGAGDISQFASVFTSLIRNSFNEGDAWPEYLRDRVSPDCRLQCGEPLAAKTTMRVGGAARYYAEPSNLCDLRALLRSASLFDLEVFYLGRGSNLIVPESGFEGLVIRFNGQGWRKVEPLGEGCLWAGAGVRLKEVCGQAAKAGLGGFEFLEGIPGSLGGSLRMNAGAMGSWIFDVVERVQMLDGEGRFLDLPKEAFHFGYRKVEEISRGIALGAILRSAEAGEAGEIRERMDSYSTTRKSSQPREPSAGCIFKNPEGGFAGKLIDEAGLKGLSVGAAEVSSVHANFIVNKGGATADDVIELVRRVRHGVKEHSGVVLEPEVLLAGACWEDLLAEGEASHV